jgi:hypothetical protein
MLNWADAGRAVVSVSPPPLSRTLILEMSRLGLSYLSATPLSSMASDQVNAGRQLVECDPSAIVDRPVDRYGVMAPAQFLHERVPRRNDAQRGNRFQTARLPQPRLEPGRADIDLVVCVLFGDVPVASASS